MGIGREANTLITISKILSILYWIAKTISEILLAISSIVDLLTDDDEEEPDNDK